LVKKLNDGDDDDDAAVEYKKRERKRVRGRGRWAKKDVYIVATLIHYSLRLTLRWMMLGELYIDCI
jgi:hypothetical protein